MTLIADIAARKRTVFIFFSLIAFLAYANSFGVPFHYDDFHFLKENIRIKSFSAFSEWLFSDARNLVSGRPLLLLSFLVNYMAGGLDTFSYHLFNLLFHIISAFLLYLLLMRLPAGKDAVAHSIRSVAAPALFLLHPLNTESVTYISSRSSILTGLFILLSMVAFFRATGGSFSPGLYILSIAAFAAGLMVKQQAVVLPGLMLVFDYFFVSEDMRDFVRRLRYHLIFLLIIVAGVVVYMPYLTDPEASRPFAEHIFTELKVFAEYLRLMLVPIGQNIDHSVRPEHFFSPGILLFLLLYLGLYLFSFLPGNRNRVVSFSLLWVAVSLLPFLFIRLNDFMAERWLYITLMGFSIFIAEAIVLVSQKSRATAAVVAVLLMLVFGMLTAARNTVYATQASIWEDAAGKSPDKYRPYANLSRAYRELGKLDKGIEAGIMAIGRGDQSFEASINLAAAYQAAEQYDKALQTLLAIKEQASFRYEYHQNLGALYEKMGEHEKSLAAFQEALIAVPHSPLVLFSIGGAYEELKDREKADDYYRRAVKEKPQHAQDFMARGVAFFRLGKGREALKSFVEAVNVDPLDVNVRLFLAENYLGNGYADDAYRHFSTAVKISPSFWQAYRGMGLVMLGKGNKKEAAVAFRKALGLIAPAAPERKELESLLARSGV
jgi:tetratricopeptide (TPR) repeat protein